MKSKELGYLGEEKAAAYLKRRGYDIIERNFTIRGGELDIVAKKGETLVFAEVKTRSEKSFGEAYEAVTDFKIEHIKNAARFFIHRHNYYDIPVRFDVIEVYITPEKKLFGTKINHIKDAF